MRRALLSSPVFIALAALALLAGSAAHAQPPPDTMAQRMQVCTACHGKEGRATREGYFPRIAGKPAGYLFNQLENFQLGRRNNEAMVHLVDHLTPAYLQEIAAYFSSLELPHPPAQPPDVAPAVLERGARLVRQGDPARQLPSCTSCHGDRMTGVQPAMPGLLGLPRDYLIAQLGAWRTGQRKSAAPDCMGTIANRLSPDDVSAVAAWLAAQDVPRDGAPAARLAAPLPLDCGSGLQ
jgi:cytochrome c553